MTRPEPELQVVQCARLMIIEAIGRRKTAKQGSGSRAINALLRDITTQCLRAEADALTKGRAPTRSGPPHIVFPSSRPPPILFSHHSHPENSDVGND